jgi:hypothetical protein
MPFDAGTIALVEDVLSDCFKYHSALDAFLTRSGISQELLRQSRAAAEKRAVDGGRFSKAPKRFVAQEILSRLATLGPDGDRLLADIITAVSKSVFRDATPAGSEAIAELKSRVNLDREEREQRQREERDAFARSERAKEQAREAKRASMAAERDELRGRFEDLHVEPDAQKRGYLLEAFLNDLFEYEALDPRRSFKLIGEQIDGSFSWRNSTCLVEAKWVKKPVAGKEFGAFNYKIEGKTVDTRGLYISINGYSNEALAGMNAKGALKFVCIDGAHIMRALVTNEGLPAILKRVWRHADETGESYLPVTKL